jgi:hypothetical protein
MQETASALFSGGWGLNVQQATMSKIEFFFNQEVKGSQLHANRI